MICHAEPASSHLNEAAGISVLRTRTLCYKVLRATAQWVPRTHALFHLAPRPIPQGSVTNRSRLVLGVSIVLLIANIVGVFVYVSRAKFGWVTPEDHELNAITGEPFIWFMAIFPVVALFVVVDVAWTYLVIVSRQRRQRYFLLLTAAIWLIGISIDFAHH